MRYLNTKNIITAGVLLSCMNSIAWGAIIPDRTRIIMNESDKGEALKLTNQSKPALSGPNMDRRYERQ